jgi:hypothetical protein
VVRVLGYRSGGPDSIPGTTRKKKGSGSGTGSTQPREYNWGATWWKSSGSCLENREYGRRNPSRWPRCTLYPQKLAITSPTSGGRSVDVVRSRTQTMEFFWWMNVFENVFMCNINIYEYIYVYICVCVQYNFHWKFIYYFIRLAMVRSEHKLWLWINRLDLNSRRHPLKYSAERGYTSAGRKKRKG